QRQGGGDARRLRPPLRIANRQPVGGSERRGGIERIATPAGREPAFPRGIAAAGKIVRQGEREEDAGRDVAVRKACFTLLSLRSHRAKSRCVRALALR